MYSLENKQVFQTVVEKVFNNWNSLRLVVEHGLGGRDGHKNAIDIMTYIYEYCTHNDNITIGELQEILEEIMDQEFNTLCEDNSILEISTDLVKYMNLLKDQNYEKINTELNNLPSTAYWLRPEIKINIIKNQDDSSSSDESDSDMDVDPNDSNDVERKPDKVQATDDGWTVVTYKK